MNNRFISLPSLIKEVPPHSDEHINDLILGKTSNSIIVGPLVHSYLCLGCISKRFRSTSFFDLQEYKPVKVEALDLECVLPVLRSSEGLSIEFPVDGDMSLSNAARHYIHSVPGCQCYG